MARAFKPTKRELVRLLVDREITGIRARLAEIDRENVQLNRAIGGGRDDVFITALNQLPLSQEAEAAIARLRSVGLQPEIRYLDRYEESIGSNRPAVAITARYSQEFDLPATEEYVDAKRRREELRQRHNHNNDERSHLLGVLADTHALNAKVLNQLPDDATPHLEALCDMLGTIIHDADKERI